MSTTPDDGDRSDNPTVDLYPYGPFTTEDGARDWAGAHLAPYGTIYTVAPVTVPYTDADIARELGEPLRVSSRPYPARAATLGRESQAHDFTRLRVGTRAETTRRGFTARDITHRELGPVVELTALGPDREDRHRAITAVLYTHYPRYTATDQGTSLLVRRRTDAELHAHADQAATDVAPHLAALASS
ncbi:hypothetical protein [Streptomyces carpinensis]|uniref:hypothetical protein n=1 Tax=Streptomyces carpinensis TaxID=66369 RepID=UPI000A395988|nr:hypothetical protein [Streptomyces carpinensis]